MFCLRQNLDCCVIIYGDKGGRIAAMIRKLVSNVIFFVFLCATVLVPQKGSCSEGLPYSTYAPVLMYHDLKPVPLNGFDVTPEAFAQQLDWLKANGYRTLSMEEYIDCIDKGSFPEKSVLITFDDGYKGIYDYAFPELKKRDMKAVFFIITSCIDGELPGYPYITAKELKEMAKDPHISIGSHTLTHPSDLREENYWDNLNEFKMSKRYLELITGRKCDGLAYPCGSYDEYVICAVKDAGYRAAFAVNTRGTMGEDTRWSVPRIYMGLSMCENNNAPFKRHVQNYAAMDDEMFTEQYYWIYQ